ncbi:MAG: dienelactone hydrolase family protein [Burkholderiaceae bacterium]
MKEIQLEVPTPDGSMPVFAAMPQDVAVAPGVLIYMDVFGPREELDDIARRFATAGYLAVVPQLFHRLGSPAFAPANRQDDALDPAAARANQATSMQMSAADTAALISFASAGGFGMATGLWGAIGYCMGGRHAIAAATTHPRHVRAALSVHGGRLVDASKASPHNMIASSTVPLYYFFAKDDPTCPAAHQELIRQAAASTAGRVQVEQLDAHHGWTFPARWCYDKHSTERVWEKALAMFRSSLWSEHQPLLD